MPSAQTARKAGATGVAAARVAVVGRAVAVVVEPIAGLGSRLGVGHALQRAADALLGPARTDALLAGAANVAASGVAVVDRAVAVVVQPVASLDRGLVVLLADDVAVLAMLRPHVADPRLTGRADAAALGIAVVGGSIAVVVEVVAELGLRRDVAHAGAPLTLDAGLRTVLALPHALRGWGAGVTRLGRAVQTEAVLVDGAVAVVVGAFAGLAVGVGVAGDTLPEHAVDALVDGLLADPQAAGDGAEPFVGLGVAVVVEPIAELSVRQDLAFAAAPNALNVADLLAREALAHPLGSRVAGVAGLGFAFDAGAVLVGLAVAVVVQPIAELGVGALLATGAAEAPGGATDAHDGRSAAATDPSVGASDLAAVSAAPYCTDRRRHGGRKHPLSHWPRTPFPEIDIDTSLKSVGVLVMHTSSAASAPSWLTFCRRAPSPTVPRRRLVGSPRWEQAPGFAALPSRCATTLACSV